MFSTVVVGTDGSDTAAAAVRLATDIARQNDAGLHLVAVARPPTVVGGAAADVTDSDVYMQLAMQKMLEETVAGIEGLDVVTHVASGPPAAAIVRIADEVGADLIVVGSKGMHGARRILGSVPNGVAHNAACHVLVAKTA